MFSALKCGNSTYSTFSSLWDLSYIATLSYSASSTLLRIALLYLLLALLENSCGAGLGRGNSPFYIC